MRFLLLIFIFYFNVLAKDAFQYSLQDIALLVSYTNNTNIIIDPEIDTEKNFYFNDEIDKNLSFKTFVFLVEQMDYKVQFNGNFYYITKNINDVPKFFYTNNPNIPLDKFIILGEKFNVDLSMSDATQIVVKYTNAKYLEDFKDYLNHYTTAKHVYLQGEILSVNETKLKDIGIDFASIANTIKSTGSFDLGLFSNINNNDAVKKIISSQGINALGDISVFISLLQATGSSEIVTRPNMLIRSGDKSVFKSGKQIRIITGSTDSIRNSGEYSSKQYEILDTGLSLECSAYIYNDVISLDFKFSVKDVNTYEPDLEKLIIDNKSYSSKFTLKNNDSVILAGLTSSSLQTNNYSIPIASDIPVFGKIFQHDEDSVNSISYLIYFKATIQ